MKTIDIKNYMKSYKIKLISTKQNRDSVLLEYIIKRIIKKLEENRK